MTAPTLLFALTHCFLGSWMDEDDYRCLLGHFLHFLTLGMQSSNVQLLFFSVHSSLRSSIIRIRGQFRNCSEGPFDPVGLIFLIESKTFENESQYTSLAEQEHLSVYNIHVYSVIIPSVCESLLCLFFRCFCSSNSKLRDGIPKNCHICNQQLEVNMN